MTLVEELCSALEAVIASLERADAREGYCCCGDDMVLHAHPMDCGHEAVDAGEYFAWRNIEYAKDVLGKAKNGESSD